MNILVLFVLLIGAFVCFLPVVMAWSHYSGDSKQTVKKTKTVGVRKTATAGNAY